MIGYFAIHAIAKPLQIPLILVCHSMGGIVAKQAFVLAQEASQYSRVRNSLRSIFFLATPHHDTDLADTLSKIFKVCAGTRPFVGDLVPASAAVQAINEAFLKYSDRLQVYSFSETVPMQFGSKTDLVVKQESSILGDKHKNETSTYLASNHVNICIYESQASSNYRIVRNAIAAALKALTARIDASGSESFSQQQITLNALLGVNDHSEENYEQLYSCRVEGSCEWITQRQAFRRWIDDEHPDPPVYWMSAKPGAGKSVLSAYLINVLRSSAHSPAFFFFGHEKKTRPSTSTFLRSSAAQIASTSPDILKEMCRICAEIPELAEADASKVWRKLFLECVIKHRPDQRFYWIIDGLNECKGERDLVSFIMQAARSGKFRIFVTSRTMPDPYGPAASSPRNEIHAEKIDETTTNSDIRLFLDRHAAELAMQDASSIHEQVLDKADGCFLWTTLALRELQQAYTRQDMQEILEEVPSELGDLYERILRSILVNTREAEMIVAIVEWTACSTRALTLLELLHALRYDMHGELVADVRRFIENTCSQLITIDSTEHVRMVHTTARDFLFSERNTVYPLDKKCGHKRLAMACLKYLTGPELAAVKIRKPPSVGKVNPPSPFAKYAIVALFEHITHLRSGQNDLATEMVKFFKMSNVLNWIERLARESNLGRLVQASMALRNYVARRMQLIPPLGVNLRENLFLDSWARDLLRLVTKFGSHLSSHPSCITSLIAPFCPSESAIHSQFASSRRGIKVAGVSSTTWDDCSATIVLDDSARTIACMTGLFAIGTQTGRVVVFEEQLCQKTKILWHGERVTRLLFGPATGVIIAVGLVTINCWHIRDWALNWSAKIPAQALSVELACNDEILFATLTSNEIRQ